MPGTTSPAAIYPPAKVNSGWLGVTSGKSFMLTQASLE
jgi:hypothetical protein